MRLATGAGRFLFCSGEVTASVTRSFRHCEERSDDAIQTLLAAMDCFAEPVIGRRLAPTRWLAMTFAELHHHAQSFRRARNTGVEPSRAAVLERKALIEEHHVVPLRALRFVHRE